MKRRRVVFTPEARNDLFEIYDWITAKVGFQIAISYIERIEGYCLEFELASERGHRRDDISPHKLANSDGQVDFFVLSAQRPSANSY